MAEPWKRYAPASQAGPWQKYAAPPPAAPAEATPQESGSVLDVVGDFASGALKGAKKTIVGMVPPVIRTVTGMDRAMEDPEVRAKFEPSNAAEQAGYTTETIAEFLPTGVAAARAVPGMVRGAARVVGRAADSPIARDLIGFASPRAGKALDTLATIRQRNAAAAAPVPTAPPQAVKAAEAGLTAHEQGLVQAVIDNPALYQDLTKPVRTKLIPELHSRGFKDFAKPKAAPQAAAPQAAPQPVSLAAPGPVAVPPVKPKPVGAAPIVAEESLEDLLSQSLEQVKARKAGATVRAEPTVIPHKPAEFGGEVFEASARATKANSLAKILHEHGIPYKDAELMTPEMWEQAAKAAGVKVPSETSRIATLFELKKLEKPTAITRK